jgi:hypothetical protein
MGLATEAVDPAFIGAKIRCELQRLSGTKKFIRFKRLK